MRAISVTTMLGIVVLLVGCSESDRAPSPVEVDLRFSQHGGESHNFGSPLSGAEEVGPVNTKARGNAIYQLNAEGTELHYRLIVANILNVTQAHIHCGSREDIGPVIVWLYPSASPAVLIPGRSDGVLSEGTATDANVIARPNSTACPGGVANLEDVVEKLRTGGAYTNVHTTAHPIGEIRGHIQERGPTR